MLQSFFKYPFLFSVAFLATYFFTPLVRRAALAFHVVDQPTERRVHQRTVPSAGGVAVYLGFHLACAAVYFLPWSSFAGNIDKHWWQNYLFVSSFVLLFGLWDDVFGLKPIAKLVSQIALSLLMFHVGVRVGNVLWLSLPLSLDLALTVLWFVGITNAFNLIDGLDGLAAGLAGIAALGIAASFLLRGLPGDALLLIGFSGACFAFLRYNFYPAQIFLGDTGSQFIGFTLAAIALSTSSKGTMLVSLGVPMLAIGVPIFDTALAVWRRSVRGVYLNGEGQNNKGVLHFDLEHLHHRMLQRSGDQRKVAFALYLANALLVALGLSSILFVSHAHGIFLLAFLVGSYVVFRHVSHVELWDSGTAILNGFRRPSSKVLAVILYPPLDLLLLGAALALVLGISRTGDTFFEIKQGFLAALPLWCVPPFLALFITGSYSRVWSRARVSEFFLLGAALIFGSLLSAGLSLLLAAESRPLSVTESLLFITLSVLLLTGLRALPRGVEDLMSWYGQRPGAEGEGRRVLLYGARERVLLYLNYRRALLGSSEQLPTIVGLLDDDRNLRKRLVYGYRVLGGVAELSAVLQMLRVDEIVITVDITVEQREYLLQQARNYAVTLSEWRPEKYFLFMPTLSQEINEVSQAPAVNE